MLNVHFTKTNCALIKCLMGLKMFKPLYENMILSENYVKYSKFLKKVNMYLQIEEKTKTNRK